MHRKLLDTVDLDNKQANTTSNSKASTSTKYKNYLKEIRDKKGFKHKRSYSDWKKDIEDP